MTEFKEGDLVRVSIPEGLAAAHARQLLDGRTGLVVKKIERAGFQGGGSLFHVFLGPAPEGAPPHLRARPIQYIASGWLKLVSRAEDDSV